MKYILIILWLTASAIGHAQVYMGGGPGVYQSKVCVTNPETHARTSYKESYFSFTALGGLRNDYNVLFESQIVCTGSFIVSGHIGYQLDLSTPETIDEERDIRDSKVNLQLFAGPADIINIYRHNQFTHKLSYAGGARLNWQPVYMQVHASASHIFTQIGIKGYLFR